MSGQTINDRYQVDLLLDQGGMSVVYRAADLAKRRRLPSSFSTSTKAGRPRPP